MKKQNATTREKQIHLMVLVGIAFIIAMGWELISNSGHGSIGYHTGEESITLTGPEDTSAEIAYADMQEITSVTDFDYGTAVDGGTKGSVNYGTWENESLGTYTSFINTGIDTVILITTEDTTYAFNYEDETATEELAKALPDFASE